MDLWTCTIHWSFLENRWGVDPHWDLHRSEGRQPAGLQHWQSSPLCSPPMKHCCDPPQTGQPPPPEPELWNEVYPQPETTRRRRLITAMITHTFYTRRRNHSSLVLSDIWWQLRMTHWCFGRLAVQIIREGHSVLHLSILSAVSGVISLQDTHTHTHDVLKDTHSKVKSFSEDHSVTSSKEVHLPWCWVDPEKFHCAVWIYDPPICSLARSLHCTDWETGTQTRSCWASLQTDKVSLSGKSRMCPGVVFKLTCSGSFIL